METCPICRARLNGAAVCRRCKSDLTQAQAVATQAWRLEGQVMLCLAQGQTEQAVRLLRRVRLLQDRPALRALERVIGG